MQYIILDEKKRATHPFKDGVGTKTWDEVKDFDNIAQIVPEPFIVLDFDTKSDAEIIQKIVEGEDLKCRMMKTTKGVHVWFRSEDPWKCFIKTRLAIGIYSDCKSHSKNAYVKIKDNGKMREWLKDTPLDEIQDVPRWLYPVLQPGEQFKFKGMEDGSGRNQELFNYIVYLQSKGFKKDEIKETIRIINEYVFAEPLSDYEIHTLTRDEAFKPEDEIEKQIQKVEKKAGWSHNEFGDELIQAFHIVTVNNQLYIYDSGFYQQDEKIIERKMIELYPSIKQSQRSEVLAYIRIKTHVPAANLKVNPYILNLENTRIDIKKEKKLDFTPKAIEFDRLPVSYDPDAYCEALDKMLDRVFCHDQEVRELFEEMIGACLIKHNRYQKAFMLYGSGANGKSTILNMIKHFLGIRNYTSISLEKVTDRFNVAELENKLANIGDDIDNVVIKDTGTLKKLFSGNSVLVERKGERPFIIEPYATHIYSANAIPRSFDKSDGFYRRWMFIPFHAKFTNKDPDYDPLIEDKITTDSAMSYLLNLGIRGAQRLIKNGKFTEPEIVQEALESYKAENSTTLSWIDDQELDINYFLDTPTDQLYSDFQDWCKQSGIQSKSVTGKKTFNKEITAKFDFEEKARQRGDRKRYFVLRID